MREGDVRRFRDKPENEGLVCVELRTRRLTLFVQFHPAGRAIAAITGPTVEIPIRKRRAASRVETPSSIAATHPANVGSQAPRHLHLLTNTSSSKSDRPVA